MEGDDEPEAVQKPRNSGGGHPHILHPQQRVAVEEQVPPSHHVFIWAG